MISRKHIFVLVASTLLTFSAVAQQTKPHPKHYHWANPATFSHRVKHNVSYGNSLIRYNYDEKGCLISKETFECSATTNDKGVVVIDNIGETPNAREVFEYNNGNYLVDIKEYGIPKNGKTDKLVLIHHDEFHRDASNYITEFLEFNIDEMTTDPDDEQLVPRNKVLYTYDNEGRISEMDNQLYNPTDKTWNPLKKGNVTYNEAGNITSIAWFVDGSTNVLSDDITYDEKGHIVKLVNYTAQGGDVAFIFKYDEHGNIVKVSRETGEFPYDITYDLKKDGKKCFIPSLPIGNTTGFRYMDACTAFYHVPLGLYNNAITVISDQGFIPLPPDPNDPEANQKKPEPWSEFPKNYIVYEPVPGSTACNTIIPTNIQLSTTLNSFDFSLTDGNAHRLQVITSSGEIMVSKTTTGKFISILRDSLPKGILLITIDTQTSKVLN